MTGGDDGWSRDGVGLPPVPIPSEVAKVMRIFASFLLLVAPIGLVVGLVALCARAKKACRNKKERRRLKERVNWLRDMLPLLCPAALGNINESGGGGTATTAQAVRTVLAGRLDATLGEAADTLDRSWGMSCCLFGLARCDAQAGRLERASAAVDEVYVEMLPVVSQIDATQSVVQMLGALQHRTSRCGDNGNPLANGHSDTQHARPDGTTEFDWQPLSSDELDDQVSTGPETAAR